jgi:hypothetical protein
MLLGCDAEKFEVLGNIVQRMQKVLLEMESQGVSCSDPTLLKDVEAMQHLIEIAVSFARRLDAPTPGNDT